MKIAPEAAQSVVEDLRTLGYDATVSERGLNIRLALFCGVTVEFHDGAIRVVPTFGFASRTAATWLTTLTLLLIAFVGPLTGETTSLPRWGFVTVAMLIAAVVWDVYRYVLTESAMSVVRNLLVSRYAA